jgi:hypothetical protein
METFERRLLSIGAGFGDVVGGGCSEVARSLRISGL